VTIPVAIHLIIFSSAYAAKKGRVVDLATGQPIADALVFATADYYVQGWWEWGAGKELYRIAVTTGKDGSFYIPASWSISPVSIFPKPDVTWSLQVAKVGYVNPYDVDPTFAQTLFPNACEINTPPHHWVGPTIDFGTIALARVSMSMENAAAYYGSLRRGIPSFTFLDPFFEYVRQKTCSDDSLSTLNYWTLQGVMHLQPNGIAFNQRFFALEPQNWKATVYDHPSYMKGDICEGLNFAKERRNQFRQ
jgi:hypothetical protein